MNYEETLEYIHDVSWRGSKPGLSRTKSLLKAIGNPEKDLKFIHIAGTNGKGSTSACLESILRHAGYKTGLYTSPFIVRFNERMQVNGTPISDDELAAITSWVKPYAESQEDHPTEFELITAVAMKYFKDNECDIVVLEVGMGGELDSTNVISVPELAVITAMGFDHVERLGPDMTHIAMAKAGIIKEGGDVVVYGKDEEAYAVFEETCKQRNASLTRTDFSKLAVHEYTLTGTRFDYGCYKDLTLALAGTYQPYNASVVITAIEKLREKGWNISDKALRDGFKNVFWPGRFEFLRSDPIFVVDGAHNPHGINAMTECIKTIFPDKKPVFLVGVMADKDVEHMTEMISQLAKSVVTVSPDNKRAMEAGTLADFFRKDGIDAQNCETIEDAVNAAIKEAGENGVVIALGSLYFSGDIRDAVRRTIK